jgi:hypothetical protein
MKNSVGSCNANIFSVNRGAFGFHNAGPNTTGREGELRYFNHRFEQPHQRLMMTPFWNTPGLNWLWEYASYRQNSFSPEMWGVCNASGQAQIVWEAEHKEDPDKPSQQPILLTNLAFQSIIPAGGFAIKIQSPAKSVLESLETDTIAVDIADVSWVSASPSWSNAENTSQLLEWIFRYETRVHGLKEYATISEVFDFLLDRQISELYRLLWLRSASKILYNHLGDTAIPLIRGKFIVDSTYGIVSL